MTLKSPEFWWQKRSKLSFFLRPVSWFYGAVAAVRMRMQTSPVVSVPVLCIGNYTLGGAGKTPVAIAMAKEAQRQGLKPGFVSRGYGGKRRGPHVVDLSQDGARDIGDEPILLAQYALVAIGKDRYQAAQRLQQLGCDLIIMDDGFQSRKLLIDYAVLVVDGLRGLGNGGVFPAGPLRAPLAVQLAYTDAIAVIGQAEDDNGLSAFLSATKKPIMQARLRPLANNTVKGKRFLAFAGIAYPQKIYNSIEQLGGEIVEHYDFADHYFFTTDDLKNLYDKAQAKKLTLATTAKDYVRFLNDVTHHHDDLKKMAENLIVFDVEVEFTHSTACADVVHNTLEKFQQRETKTA